VRSGFLMTLAIMAALVAGLATATLWVAGCGGTAPPPDSGDAKDLRILSLTPNVTEILFAMGLGDRIVGRSNYCTWPPEALAIPAVGDTLQMNQEKIIALRPTMAFLITSRTTVIGALEKMGLRTVALRSDRMDELLVSIRTIGRETGRPEAAEALVGRIQKDLAAVRDRVKGRPRPRTLFAFPMTVGSAQMMVAGRGTFVDELLTVAGAENVFPDASNWPTISTERIIGLAPEVVIVNATGDDAAGDRLEVIRRAWANWTSVPAVAAGRVYILTEPYLTIPGPRVGLAAEKLAEVIHPPATAGAFNVFVTGVPLAACPPVSISKRTGCKQPVAPAAGEGGK